MTEVNFTFKVYFFRNSTLESGIRHLLASTGDQLAKKPNGSVFTAPSSFYGSRSMDKVHVQCKA